jgi:DnaJ-class molecular chaperone
MVTQCPHCEGTGQVVLADRGWEFPVETSGPCHTCHGAGEMTVMCDVCCKVPATVETGDAELPHACAECAKIFEART